MVLPGLRQRLPTPIQWMLAAALMSVLAAVGVAAGRCAAVPCHLCGYRSSVSVRSPRLPGPRAGGCHRRVASPLLERGGSPRLRERARLPPLVGARRLLPWGRRPPMLWRRRFQPTGWRGPWPLTRQRPREVPLRRLRARGCGLRMLPQFLSVPGPSANRQLRCCHPARPTSASGPGLVTQAVPLPPLVALPLRSRPLSCATTGASRPTTSSSKRCSETCTRGRAPSLSRVLLRRIGRPKRFLVMTPSCHGQWTLARSSAGSNQAAT